jgi:deoxyribonuclease V
MSIAFVDVHYKEIGARAACVVTESWEDETPHSIYVQDIEAVAPYEPGNFYRRELPCILSVLRLLPALPETVVVDGYVWLSSVDRPGLGARLYEALGRGTPVVGIAKTAFKGVESCTDVVRVVRGMSRKPLFVTAVGIEPEAAAQCVRLMAGKHRIPEIVRMTDGLSRGRAFMWKTAFTMCHD